MRIGNRTQASEWCHFQWPWVTRSLDLTSNNAKVVQDRAILTMANQYRKSSNGAIVNDPEQPQNFKVTPLFNAEYLRNGTRYRHTTNLRHSQECHIQWFWVNLSDLVKYLMSWSIARSLCDSRVSCSSHCSS